TRLLLFILVVFTIGTYLESFYNSRYSAPATGLILALSLLAIQKLRKWNLAGLFLSRSIPMICVLTFALRLSAGALHIPLKVYNEFGWHQRAESSFGRADVQNKLESIEGEHLVIVHYASSHEPF